jgi:hypothetical protein
MKPATYTVTVAVAVSMAFVAGSKLAYAPTA